MYEPKMKSRALHLSLINTSYINLVNKPTERRRRMVSTPHSYSRRPRFISRPGEETTEDFRDFPRYLQASGQCRKRGHDRSLQIFLSLSTITMLYAWPTSILKKSQTTKIPRFHTDRRYAYQHPMRTKAINEFNWDASNLILVQLRYT
jgi:hypothetical protein